GNETVQLHACHPLGKKAVPGVFAASVRGYISDHSPEEHAHTREREDGFGPSPLDWQERNAGADPAHESDGQCDVHEHDAAHHVVLLIGDALDQFLTRELADLPAPKW